MSHVETLAQTEFFAGADAAQLGPVADAGIERLLVRGDVLFNEGDPPSKLYMVLSGRFAIAIANPIDRRESVVALMEPYDLFGEMGMLDQAPVGAGPSARTDDGPGDPVRAGAEDVRGRAGTAVERRPAAGGAGYASPTRRWPTRCSSTSPAGPPSGCSSWPTAPTPSRCR